MSTQIFKIEGKGICIEYNYFNNEFKKLFKKKKG